MWLQKSSGINDHVITMTKISVSIRHGVTVTCPGSTSLRVPRLPSQRLNLIRPYLSLSLCFHPREPCGQPQRICFVSRGYRTASSLGLPPSSTTTCPHRSRPSVRVFAISRGSAGRWVYSGTSTVDCPAWGRFPYC